MEIRDQEDRLRDYIPDLLVPVLETGDYIKTRCQGPTKHHRQNAMTTSFQATTALERGGNRPGKNSYHINILDNRKRILETSKFPHSAHGLLRMKFRDWKISAPCIYGTGTLISPHLVLTAAHNVYDYRKHNDEKDIGEVEEITFIPGMDGKNSPFREIGIKKGYWYVPNEYKING